MVVVFMLMFIFLMVSIFYLRLPKFGRLPQGERLKRIEQSVNYHNGTFNNLHITPQIVSDRGLFGAVINFLFEKRVGTRPDGDLPVVKTDLKSFDINENVLVWFGHSSYFMQVDGKRILIDPVFEDASPVSFVNKAFKGTDIYKPEDMPDIDYLIITHDHWDHLDYETVKKLKGRISNVICPLGVGEYFEYWGFDVGIIKELDWDESVKFDDEFKFYCLPARHFSGRLLKPNKTLWASFLIESASLRIFASGDGGYDTHFAEIGKQFPNIDLAIMENGQYNKDWRYIHLIPEELEKAIYDLNPKRIITGHHSKFALAKHQWDEPLNNIAGFNEKNSFDIMMPMIGQVVHLSDSASIIDKWWVKQ